MAQSAYLSLSCLPLPTFIEGGHAELHADGRMVSRVHLEYFMFIFVRKGTLMMSVDGKEQQVHRDELFILVAGDHRYAWWAETPEVEIDWLYVFVAGEWTLKNEPAPIKNGMAAVSLHANVPVQTLFLRQHQAVEDPDSIKETMDQLVPQTITCESKQFFNSQALFIQLLNKLRAQDNAQNLMIQVSLELQAYLRSHFQNKITATTLEKEFNRPATFLTKAFRQTVGMTPTDFLNQYRMEEAGRQLLNTGLSISEIASRVGFQNIYYFSTSFKKYAGTSPSRYRQFNSIETSENLSNRGDE